MTIKRKPTGNALVITPEMKDARLALITDITSRDMVPANDVPLIIEVVETHKAKLARVFELIEEFSLDARGVALLYETRDSFGDKEAPSLAALARTLTAFPEFVSSDHDDLATEVTEAVQQVRKRWPGKSIFADTVLKHVIAEAETDGLSFSQALEQHIGGADYALDDEGEPVYDD